jgi:Undecaprenyl-phosphate glucose phosphotransferase
LVVGTGPLATQVVTMLHEQTFLGIRVLGHIATRKADVGTSVADRPVLADVGELRTLLGDYQRRGLAVDQVIVALPVQELAQLEPLMEALSQETVDVRLVPDVVQYMTLCGGVEEFGGLPIIHLQSTPMIGWNRVLKRAVDLSFAGLGLVLCAPVLLLMGLLIRLSDGGPALFRQLRVGLDGKPFHMYKFRTMRVGAEAAATWTHADDPRKTRLGRLLRKFSIDELPQLWNVVCGDMSLVGPRPEQPAYTAEFVLHLPRYALRNKIKAGITGWAQVNGLRGDTSIEQRVQLDLYYIEHWSLALDLKILLRTVFGGFLSPNAY